MSCAAKNGQLEAVRWPVVEGKAGFDSKDKDGKTPLSYAAEYEPLEVLK